MAAVSNRVGLKMTEPCTQMEVGKKRGSRKTQPTSACCLRDGKPVPIARYPTLTPTSGSQPRTSILPAFLSCTVLYFQRSTWGSDQPLEQSGLKNWVSKALLQICFITKQNQVQRNKEKGIWKIPTFQNSQSSPSLYAKKINQQKLLTFYSNPDGQGLAK